MRQIKIFDQPNNLGQLDLSGVAKTFHHFYSGFHPVECADLFTILETIVLREKVILIGKEDGIQSSHLEYLRPFINSGVFVLNKIAFPIPQLFQPEDRIRTAAEQAHNQQLTMCSPRDANFEVSRSLGAEQYLGLPSTPLLRNLQHFGYQKKPKIEHHLFFSLYDGYKNLSDEASLRKRIDFEKVLIPIQLMPLPPVALEVLRECKTIHDLPAASLTVRDRYKIVREHYANYVEVVSDPKTSAMRVASETNKLRSEFDKIKNKIVRGQVGISLTSKGLLNDPHVYVNATKAVFLGDRSAALDLGNNFWEALVEAIPSLRMSSLRPLHRSVSNYLLSPPDTLRAELSRLFEMDPVRIHNLMCQLAQMKEDLFAPSFDTNNNFQKRSKKI